jgi:hypothetical protein
MVPRLAIGFALLIALVAASLASSAAATVSATATLTGSGTSYRMTVRNTGDEPILCFGLLLDGVQPTSASGPAGVLTRVGTFQGRGLVHMQGNAATPAVPPGGTATVDFRTNVAVPPNAGGEIRYSSTCQPGSDQVGRATGPTPPPSPPPPPPKPKPKCQCKDLQIIDGKRRPRTNDDFAVDFEWRLTCTPKDGRRGCEGKIEVVPPKQGKFTAELRVPANGERVCKGTCRRVTEGPAFVGMSFRPGDPVKFLGQTFRFKLKLFCKRGSRYVAVGTQTASIVFKERGFTGSAIDPVQSDFNANGTPDGDEKKS